MKTARAFSWIPAVALIVVVFCGSAAERKWKLPPETAKFKPGPGAELAIGNCVLCHSADYISTQPPLSRAAWAASVQKMREKYGAPVPTNTVDALVEYLVKNYGTEKPR